MFNEYNVKGDWWVDDIEELLYNADVFRCEGDYDEAIGFYQRAVALIGDNRELQYRYETRIYRQMCFCYRKIDKIDAAIQFGQKSVRCAQKYCMKHDQDKESRTILAKCYMNLGVIYDERKQYAEAVRYYQMGIEIFKEYDKDFATRNLYINALLSMGTVMFELEQFDDSQVYFEQITNFLQSNEDDGRHAYATKYIDMIQQKKGERIQ